MTKKRPDIEGLLEMAEVAAIGPTKELQGHAWLAQNEVYVVARLEAVPKLCRYVQELEHSNQCDACAGTGKPVSGIPCMCGGTGKMSDAAVYLRERLSSLEAAGRKLVAACNDDRAASYGQYVANIDAAISEWDKAVRG